MLKRLLFFFLVFSNTISYNLSSQNNYLNKNFDYYFESVLNLDSSLHYTIKPYGIDCYKNSGINRLHSGNRFFNKILNDHLVSLKTNKLNVTVNPILNTMFFNDFGEKKIYEDYKAGVSLRVDFSKRIFLNSDIFFAQTVFPSFYNDLVNNYHIVPRYGKFIKNSNNTLLYYSWTGGITYRANKNISFTAGRGKHFLGNGYRSLFLSDNSNAYPFIKAEVDIWKIKYLWMAAKLSDINLSEGANPLVLFDKAAFIHYFSLNITKRINFDFFETVITNPFNLEGRRVSYDIVYFNPVIFYRPAEFYKGSSDNSLMGIGLNIRLWKSCFLYSQFILDDMVISSLRDGSGWWGNKFGIQAGAKIYNFFKIPGLFLRGEINAVRPYTYSHGEAYITTGIANLNYGSFKQAAAHPFGGNFVEGIAVIRYVKGRFSGEAGFNLIKKGEDIDSISYGGDIYKSYSLRPSDYGIKFLQGTPVNYKILNLGLSYLINPKYDLMLKTGFYFRSKKNSINTENSEIFYIGLSSSLFNSDF